jgi:hypothetical protein
MASFSQRGKVWRAQVRRANEPRVSQSFDTKASAVAWANEYEARIADPKLPTPKAMMMADLMDRYSLEISPHKAGGRWEVIRIMALRPAFTAIEAVKLDRACIAAWRDARLNRFRRPR